MQKDDFRLPALHPFLKLYKAPDEKSSGEPVWTLHHPVANTYFRLQWIEFECLSRFSRCRTAVQLKNSIESETTLRIDLDDIRRLVVFLNENGLITLTDQIISGKSQAQIPWWKRILHGYLYFTIPLFKPQKFLERYLYLALPILSPQAFSVMSILFLIAVGMTVPRFDEFLHTFADLFSMEGVVLIALTLGFVKIVHELGHAFTAVKNGVSVPHMGVAFIVLYPVLYTETTGGWKLSSRKDRFEIGFAGIRAEFFLATLALLLWNFSPVGSSMQSLCFMVVAISMLSSLMVNLNPLMRFDGYYMLSDAMGIENLQGRSCDFARWKIRSFLFGLQDSPPEDVDDKRKKFLVLFGLALLIYRFFLFTGIAVAVYHIFFQPLGFILMMVEVSIFIIRPVWSELKIWHARCSELCKLGRARQFGVIILFLFLVYALPIHRDIGLPAVSYTENYRVVYPSAPAIVSDLFVQEGDVVKKDEVLAVLYSPSLEKDYALALAEFENLESIKRGVQADTHSGQKSLSFVEDQIQEAQKKVQKFRDAKDRLVVVAPFDGQVRDMLSGLQKDRGVMTTDLLFRIVGQGDAVYSAYIHESDLSRVQIDQTASFIPDICPVCSVPLVVKKISLSNVETLDLPEVSSCFGGRVQSECEKAQEGIVLPVQSLYRVDMIPVDRQSTPDQLVLRGEVRIQGDFFSPFYSFIKALVGKVIREIGLS